MEQHPLPRQITSFEFKLIGFMTLKQFLYLVIFAPLGFVVYRLVPIPVVRELLGILVGVVGLLFAFVPVNDRPLDYFIKTLIKRLLSPTQYTFHKENRPIYFLQNLYYLSDPHKVFTHIESQEKLAAYLTKVKKVNPSDALRDRHRTTVASALQNTSTNKPPPQGAKPEQKQHTLTMPQPNKPTQNAQQAQRPQTDGHKQPFFIGIVKNHKQIPSPNILVYIKDGHGATLRILKSNANGVFATYNKLPAHSYQISFADPKGIHTFDTMNINIKETGNTPIEVFSKELL